MITNDDKDLTVSADGNAEKSLNQSLPGGFLLNYVKNENSLFPHISTDYE